MNHCRTALMILVLGLGLGGCATHTPVISGDGPVSEELSFDQFAQTDFNRTVTIAMRDNLDSLTRLLEKLYRRNPREWRKSGAPDLDTAVRQGSQAIKNGRAPADLQGLRDIQILSVALDPQY